MTRESHFLEYRDATAPDNPSMTEVQTLRRLRLAAVSSDSKGYKLFRYWSLTTRRLFPLIRRTLRVLQRHAGMAVRARPFFTGCFAPLDIALRRRVMRNSSAFIRRTTAGEWLLDCRNILG